MRQRRTQGALAPSVSCWLSWRQTERSRKLALSGLQIFKLLPRTNCKDCGFPTCMAFAMQLAAGKAELSQCPHVSDEAAAELGEASAPPVRKVTIGDGDYAVTIGAVSYTHLRAHETKAN